MVGVIGIRLRQAVPRQNVRVDSDTDSGSKSAKAHRSEQQPVVASQLVKLLCGHNESRVDVSGQFFCGEVAARQPDRADGYHTAKLVHKTTQAVKQLLATVIEGPMGGDLIKLISVSTGQQHMSIAWRESAGRFGAGHELSPNSDCAKSQTKLADVSWAS